MKGTARGGNKARHLHACMHACAGLRVTLQRHVFDAFLLTLPAPCVADAVRDVGQ